jgi:uncharacterized protein (DUF427 family)
MNATNAGIQQLLLLQEPRATIRPALDRVRSGDLGITSGFGRPPAIVPEAGRVVIRYGDLLVADTRSALRVVETAGTSTLYLPPHAVARHRLRRVPGKSREGKGYATFWSLHARGVVLERVGWSYENAVAEYADLTGYFSFDPYRLDCFVGGERALVRPSGPAAAGSPMKRWAGSRWRWMPAAERRL